MLCYVMQIKFWLWIFSSLFSHHYSPVDSSRFGSSGNLSQTSSQLSETGQESTGGSELEETFHSYHSTGFHPSASGQPRTNGHLQSNGHPTGGEREIHRLSPEVGRGLKNDNPSERSSSKLQRYIFFFFSEFNLISYVSMWRRLFMSLNAHGPGSTMMGRHYRFPHPESVGWRPLIKSGFSCGR